MADIIWDRIEPHTRSENLDEGLESRIADALWMLGRQWQAGELRGEDAASPIHARLKVGWARFRSFRNDAAARPQVEPFVDGRPLEARVESETVMDTPGALQIAADFAVEFLRRLDGAGLGHLRPGFVEAFALEVPAALARGLTPRHRRRLDLLRRRGVDGRKLYRAGRRQLALTGATADEIDEVLALHQTWRDEIGGRFVEPGPSGDCWADERLEYSFSVAAPLAQGEAVLTASGYPGGHLDWYSFDYGDEKSAHGLAARSAEDQVLNLMPIPLSYVGMPVSRWWELEEGTVYFGGIEAGPADLGRLLVAEFATIYSDDWFLVPVRLPAASLARVSAVEVVDTFGGVHEIKAAAVYDQEEVGEGQLRPWSFFELAGDPGAAMGRAPWLLVPPSLVASVNGAPLERVSFVRDEAANLAWGIEDTVETPTGRPMRRRLQWGLAPSAQAEEPENGSEAVAPQAGGDTEGEETVDPVDPSTATTTADDAWTWKLQQSVPPYWVPFIAERVEEGSAEVRLRRARMLAWQELDPALVGAQGRILAPQRPLRLYEEEIPRGGLEVTRAWQLARGADGRLHLWLARRKRPGRGERGSGLKFDAVKR